MYFIGVDGCRKGWIVISIQDEHNYLYSIHENINALYENYTSAENIYIDIPIGLPDIEFERKIEKLAKPFLTPYKVSSLFSVPCRQAVYSVNYIEAKKANIKTLGCSISIQSWNICTKIKEVDILITNLKNKHPFKEAHPELCFSKLNNKIPLKSKKSLPYGQQERLNILNKYHKNSTLIFNAILENTKRKDVKADDILDALCLAVCAFICKSKNWQKIQDSVIKDTKGIEMALYYPQID